MYDVDSWIHNNSIEKSKYIDLMKKTIQLSRTKNRSIVLDYELYNNIAILVELYFKNDDEKYNIFRCMFILYYPFIIKYTLKFYYKLRKRKYLPYSLFKEIIQESYVILYNVIDRYNCSRSSLTYYLRKYLMPNIKRYVITTIRDEDKKNVSIAVNSQAVDKRQNTEGQAISNLFYEEYLSYIEKIKSKKSKTRTRSIVCDEYFLNYKSIKEISEQLGISYWSVNEHIARLKNDLCCLINNSKYSSYCINVTRIGKYSSRSTYLPSEFRIIKR